MGAVLLAKTDAGKNLLQSTGLSGVFDWLASVPKGIISGVTPTTETAPAETTPAVTTQGITIQPTPTPAGGMSAAFQLVPGVDPNKFFSSWVSGVAYDMTRLIQSTEGRAIQKQISVDPSGTIHIGAVKITPDGQVNVSELGGWLVTTGTLNGAPFYTGVSAGTGPGSLEVTVRSCCSKQKGHEYTWGYTPAGGTDGLGAAYNYLARLTDNWANDKAVLPTNSTAVLTAIYPNGTKREQTFFRGMNPQGIGAQQWTQLSDRSWLATGREISGEERRAREWGQVMGIGTSLPPELLDNYAKAPGQVDLAAFKAYWTARPWIIDAVRESAVLQQQFDNQLWLGSQALAQPYVQWFINYVGYQPKLRTAPSGSGGGSSCGGCGR